MAKKYDNEFKVMTGGLNRFKNAKQLYSYTGITPIIREPDSSVRGRSRISKMGKKDEESVIFM